MPVTTREGDLCSMSSTIVRGEGEATLKDTGENTMQSKIAVLLQDSEEKSD